MSAGTKARAADVGNLRTVARAQIEHDYVDEKEQGACTVCHVSFNNPTTKAAFMQMFAIKDTEVLNGVEINERGLTAFIGRKLK